MRDMDIITEFQHALVEELGEDRFDLWFRTVASFKVLHKQLVISTKDDFTIGLIRSQFGGILKNLVTKFTALEDIVFSVANEENARKHSPSNQTAHQQNGFQPVLVSAAKSNATCANGRPRPSKKPATTPAESQTPRKFRKPLATLQEFATGSGNSLAFAAIGQAIESPGRCSPLLLHGPTSVGKTHLLDALRSEVRKRYPRINVLYLTGEQFTGTYVDALKRRELPSFRHKFRGVDLLLLDDAHFIMGKSATLVELQHTIDTLLRAGKQIVITTDKAPNRLNGLGEEVVSRLTAGLVCEISPPDYSTRVEISRLLAKRMQLSLSDQVHQSIATHIATNAREIFGALHRLQAASSVARKPITKELAEQTLVELAQQNAPQVGLVEIEQAVCDAFGLGTQALKSKRSAKSIAAGRTLAMWLARKYTRNALSEIGHYFGRRSHSTVISAGKRVTRWVNENSTVQMGDRVCDVEEAIRNIEDRLRRA